MSVGQGKAPKRADILLLAPRGSAARNIPRLLTFLMSAYEQTQSTRKATTVKAAKGVSDREA